MTATKRTYSQEEVNSVVDRLYGGSNVQDLAAVTGIPEATIRHWQAKYESPRGEELRRKQRAAFVDVIENVNKIRSVVGQIQAMDYVRAIDGSSAQYSTTDHALQVIDFLVDVDRAIKSVATPQQLVWFNENIKEGDLESVLETQSLQFMHLQEKLGRVFILRDLFPVSKYFTVTKK